MYYDTLKSAFPRRTNAGQQRRVECKGCGDYFFGTSRFCPGCKKPTIAKRSLDDTDKSARKAFLAAADVCIEMDADAREFVLAQFAQFRSASAHYGKAMIPMPQALTTLAARARYLQYKLREYERTARTDKDDDEQGDEQRWYVEERKLRGYARLQRRDPIDVLTEQPEQFSRDFLKHKGVWKVVRDLWEERQGS